MTTQIFRDRTVLEADTEPPELVGRRKEIRLTAQLVGASLNTTPASTIFSGTRGSGRSAVLDATCRAIETRAASMDGASVGIATVDCEPLTDRRDLWFAILETLGHQPSQDIPTEKRRYATHTWLLEQIERLIDDRDVFVFALDDVSAINRPDRALERLVYLDDAEHGPRVGFVATAGGTGFLDQSHALRRKHLVRRIVVARLEPAQYERAIRGHAEAAFEPGIIEDDAIRYLVDRGYEELHIGTAVAVLRQAGDRAKHSNADGVEKAHVRRAFEDYDVELGIEWIHDSMVDVHDQAILLALADHGAEIRADKLYEEYAAIIEESGGAPLSDRRYTDRIDGGVLEHFVDAEESSQSNEYENVTWVSLHGEPRMVYAALEDEANRAIPNRLLPEQCWPRFTDLGQPHG